MEVFTQETGETARRNVLENVRGPGVTVLPTGVPNLDEVLGGGLPAGALIILVGPPGSGKTTMASQIAFARARAGQRVLFFTALSEPTNKLIAHLQTYAFCDTSLVGTAIQIFSMQSFLVDGLEKVADHVVEIARRARADLIVLDGFRGIRDANQTSASAPQHAGAFLYDVGTKLSLLGITTLITSEADTHDPMFFAEATTTDVIIGLHYHLVDERARRALEIVKVRGSRLLPGLHGFRLDERGGYVYPRLEARVASPTAAGEPETNDPDGAVPLVQESGDGARAGAPDTYEFPQGRAAFGLAELDALLGGGLPRETSTLLVGSLGTGKTLMALHFALAGVRAGEPVLYLGFRENQQQLVRLASAFAIGDELRRALLPGGGLTWQRWAPVELNPDMVADQLLVALGRSHARRLVIDGIAELEQAIIRVSGRTRVTDFIAALIESLHERHITSLFITEHPKVVAAAIDFSTDPISVVAENVLLLQQLRYQTELHRVLSVLKMRLSVHDLMLREFVISAPDGIHVLQPRESPVDALASLAEGQQPARDRRAPRASASHPNDAPARHANPEEEASS